MPNVGGAIERTKSTKEKKEERGKAKVELKYSLRKIILAPWQSREISAVPLVQPHYRRCP